MSNSTGKPVAYASKALNKAECNYSTIEKELLAVVWAVRHFRPYLYGRKFEVLTDHRPLVYLFSHNNPSSRLTKFRLALEEYDFDIIYKKGTDNVIADALSRMSINELKDLNDKIGKEVLVTTRSESKALNNNQSDTKANDKLPGQKLETSKVMELVFNDAHELPEVQIVLQEDKIIIKPVKTLIQLRRIMTTLKNICVEYKINELVITENNDKALKFYNEIHMNDLIKGMPKICLLKKIVKNVSE